MHRQVNRRRCFGLGRQKWSTDQEHPALCPRVSVNVDYFCYYETYNVRVFSYCFMNA